MTIILFKRYLHILCALLILIGTPVYAGNKVLGEVDFEGATNVEQDSGVWVDGQYLGYLKELKESKKVLLLPGIIVPPSRFCCEHALGPKNGLAHRDSSSTLASTKSIT
jgi:hypothetical protein